MSMKPWCVLPSSPTQPGPVHGEHDRQVLDDDIVHDGVEPPLQEGGVDRDDGPDALGREARGERHRVLLGDPDVEYAVGVLSTWTGARPVPSSIAAVTATTRGSASMSWPGGLREHLAVGGKRVPRRRAIASSASTCRYGS